MIRLPQLILLISLIQHGALAYATPPADQPAQQPGVPAAIRPVHGVPTLHVDGAPFLILGAQCDIWRSTRQDAKTVAFFDGYQAMNATTVSVGIPWSKLEPEEDRYEFAFLDWFIQQAESHHLKLIVNLFNSNVCGKVKEGDPNASFQSYPPAYILSHPETYQRMILPYDCQYDAYGPPMCPNDPRTLERERRLVVRVAERLRQCDVRRTVIMVQLDNEFYYQQWVGKQPKDAKAVRCQCPSCIRRWKAGSYRSGEDFMFRSFADYANEISNAFSKVYPLPLYLNSPWWNPDVIPIFLDRCPHLSLIGIDGILSPVEPNILSLSQRSRNIPFAAENPTEHAATRFNLDVLPYYTLLGQQGIGNLLWECGPPHTVVDDPVCRARYRDALTPLKRAMRPIANTRGTDSFGGWYALRTFSSDLKADKSGNYLAPPNGKIVQQERFFIREGASSRIAEGNSFQLKIGSATLQVAESSAGIVFLEPNQGLVLATSAGRITLQGGKALRAETGQYVNDQWVPDADIPLLRANNQVILTIPKPAVIRIFQ
jgi:hypothetical protein